MLMVGCDNLAKMEPCFPESSVLDDSRVGGRERHFHQVGKVQVRKQHHTLLQSAHTAARAVPLPVATGPEPSPRSSSPQPIPSFHFANFRVGA